MKTILGILVLIAYIAFFHWISGFYEFHVAFLGGIVKAIGAGKEAKRLQGLADSINPERPEYKTPQAITQANELAYNQAQGDMAGYNRQIDQAGGKTANTLATARNYAGSGTDLLQNLALAGERETQTVNNINMNNQMFKQDANRQLNSSLMTMGQYKDQEFEYNENQPYQQQEMDKRAYQQGASNQRIAKTDAWGETINGLINTGVGVLTGGANSILGGIMKKKTA